MDVLDAAKGDFDLVVTRKIIITDNKEQLSIELLYPILSELHRIEFRQSQHVGLGAERQCSAIGASLGWFGKNLSDAINFAQIRYLTRIAFSARYIPCRVFTKLP